MSDYTTILILAGLTIFGFGMLLGMWLFSMTERDAHPDDKLDPRLTVEFDDEETQWYRDTTPLHLRD